MRKRYLITGVAGSGKSTICRAFNKAGFKAYDIENKKYDLEGLYTMVDKTTGKRMKKHSNDKLEKVKRGNWNCNVKKLEQLINSETAPVSFCCGTATNLEEIVPLFDKVVLLKATPETLRERLSKRTVGQFGRTKEV